MYVITPFFPKTKPPWLINPQNDVQFSYPQRPFALKGLTASVSTESLFESVGSDVPPDRRVPHDHIRQLSSGMRWMSQRDFRFSGSKHHHDDSAGCLDRAMVESPRIHKENRIGQ